MSENLQKHSFVPRAGFEKYFKILNLTAVYQCPKISYILIINNISYMLAVIRASVRY
jgi:hypothetical protein